MQKLPVLILVILFAITTSSAMADPRQRNNGPRFNSSYNPSYNASFNRDFRNHVKTVNRHGTRYNAWSRNNAWKNNRFDRNWNRGYNSSLSNRNRFFGNFYDNRSRYRPIRHDNWSVSLNFGSGYSSWYSSGFTTGIGSAYFGNNYMNSYGTSVLGRPYFPLRNPSTVVYNQPTVVYVNDSSRGTGHKSERGVSRSARPGLLRDIHGDCYERTYDSQGRETRIQLPASACNF